MTTNESIFIQTPQNFTFHFDSEESIFGTYEAISLFLEKQFFEASNPLGDCHSELVAYGLIALMEMKEKLAVIIAYQKIGTV